MPTMLLEPGRNVLASVIVSPTACELERLAARELGRYLGKLFGIRARISPRPTRHARVVFLIGSPATNPAIAEATARKPFPALSEQGIVLRRLQWQGLPTLLVGGGSSRATLWAVYELVERWGVRFLLHGDVFPERARFRLPRGDIQIEPRLSIRQWRVFNELAFGPISWGMADYRPFIDQLAKLKINRLLLYLWPFQPFLDYKVGGVRRRSATLFFGFRYPITKDMPGRSIFGRAREFWNPDMPVRAAYNRLAASGERLVKNVIRHARARGMECVIPAHLLEYPREFATLLKDARKIHQIGDLTIVPGPHIRPEDPALMGLASEILRTLLRTYPGISRVALDMPEFRQWAGRYRHAWKVLDKKYGVSRFCPLSDLLARARRRKNYPGGPERAVQEVKGDLVALLFYDRLLHQGQALTDLAHSGVQFVFNSVAEELLPLMPRILPGGCEALHFIDYTPARILKRRQVLRRLPARELPSSLIFTLQDDNIGVLPQLMTGSLHQLARALGRGGWAGYSTRYWLTGDQEPCAAYLARAGWDPSVTPSMAYRDLIDAVCGKRCVPDMLATFREVEAATVKLEWHGLGLTFPVPGMMMKHWKDAPMPDEWKAVRRGYQRALEHARRARLMRPRPGALTSNTGSAGSSLPSII